MKIFITNILIDNKNFHTEAISEAHMYLSLLSSSVVLTRDAAMNQLYLPQMACCNVKSHQQHKQRSLRKSW